MKSRITIEVDFENKNRPVIQVLRAYSDDVRDTLLGNFIETLKHGHQWCKVEYKGETGIEPVSNRIIQRWHLSPMTDEDTEVLATKTVHEMATQSLAPDRFQEWEYVLDALKMVRKALNQNT